METRPASETDEEAPADPAHNALWRRLRSSASRAEFMAAPPDPGTQTSSADGGGVEATEDGGAGGRGTGQRDEVVQARVRELLQKYPTIGSRQLYEYAVRQHPELQEAGLRSFHARYVLPLKRQKGQGGTAKPRARREPGAPVRQRRSTKAAATPSPDPTPPAQHAPRLRAEVRSVLQRLARQVAVADTRAELVDALAGVEAMVDEIMSALHRTESD